MNKGFELFQSEFKKWQQKFGLTGYRIYFKHESLDGAFANISINQGDMVVTSRLNTTIPNEDKSHVDIKQIAKHEALHLLVGRLSQNGRYRYISENELVESIEELVFRLEGLVK